MHTNIEMLSNLEGKQCIPYMHGACMFNKSHDDCNTYNYNYGTTGIFIQRTIVHGHITYQINAMTLL